MKPRILFVITTLDVGGAEKHLLWLAQGLIARGFEIEVVYLKGGGRLTPDFEKIGARVAKIPFEKASRAAGTIRDLARHIRRGRFDLVHTHLLKADALGAVACAIAGQRAVVASKHNEEQVLKKPIVGIVHGFLSRIPGRTIALSDYVKEFVARAGRVPRSRLQRIYYGIDPDRIAGGDRARTRAALGLRDGTHVGLCVARFHPQKDHPTLFRAVDRLKRAGRDAVLLLAGGDPFYGHKERLEAEVKAMDLDDRVRFLGIRDDVPDLLAASDVFVLPSLYEGLGLVFLEAMAASVPVIATDGTAIPEVVEHGRTGTLIRIGDDAALAAAWAALIDDPELGRAMGRAGRERLEKLFTLPRMIDETLAVYRAAGLRT